MDRAGGAPARGYRSGDAWLHKRECQPRPHLRHGSESSSRLHSRRRSQGDEGAVDYLWSIGAPPCCACVPAALRRQPQLAICPAHSHSLAAFRLAVPRALSESGQLWWGDSERGYVRTDDRDCDGGVLPALPAAHAAALPARLAPKVMRPIPIAHYASLLAPAQLPAVLQGDAADPYRTLCIGMITCRNSGSPTPSTSAGDMGPVILSEISSV